MSNDVNTLFWLILAIDSKEQVKIKYAGDSTCRVIEPYVIGENKSKEVMLRAFDTSKNDWRLFKVSKIKEIQSTGKKFAGLRAGYNSSSDKAMKKILRRVK